MTQRAPFGERLAAAIDATGPLCVGIDPSADARRDWGLADAAEGAAAFGAAIVEAATGIVPVVKPQSAYFERLGPPGVLALAEVCRRAHDAGLLVLLDAKRGDIGSTNRAYAEAYLREDSPIPVDAMTVSPYAGVGSLEPCFAIAEEHGSGLFVLARTSNPEGSTIQAARLEDGRRVADAVTAEVGRRNEGSEVGSFGLVVGATDGDRPVGIERMGGFVLAPGIGTQGADPARLGERFAGVAHRVLPTASRSIATVGPDATTLAAAMRATRDACEQGLRDRAATGAVA